ncbi:GNAT family N-acetyltransferase [Roseibium sediminicola]|uniref:GNAT family N-acetyltransferase n=1 Tax=Roseibium sediminicola TaxID=2933272 RepID=A0ABT0GWH3_9HYPH|nr:GNAT family N-acetyltransferase [Roseibium sp. CAU 1639]MCK7613407.1 GNAT family N-acetyltransferase [Roseibium sp. CAU 1639]
MHSLETGRHVLRPPEERDFPVYGLFFGDGEASRFYGGPLRTDQAWRVLAGHLGHWHLRGYGMWVIEPKDGSGVIGGCGFVWPEGWPRRELTWWLLPEARGTGAAVEVSEAAIHHAYETYGWPQVETHMNDDNHAAWGLVRKLGGKPIARERFPDGLERTVYGLPQPA